MKVTTVLSTAILFLLPGAIVPASAQEHEQEKQPEQKQQAKPAARQQQAKPAKQSQQAQHQPTGQACAATAAHAASQPKAKPAKQPQQAQHQQKAKPAQQQQQHATRQQQAKPAQQQQRGQEQQRASRGAQSAGGHGSIPEAQFRASFGSGHTFHVNRSRIRQRVGTFSIRRLLVQRG